MTDTPLPDLSVTHHSTVTPDQIDHLGHMNVRHYWENAVAGSHAMVVGLLGETAPVTHRSHYTRHHAEQLVDSRLEVRSGVVATQPTLRLYHELRNAETGVVAATFLHELGTDRPVEAATSELPEHGRPRSLTPFIDVVAAAPPLAELQAHGLEARRSFAIGDEQTLGGSTVHPARAPMVIWGGPPLDDSDGPFLHEGPNGERMGWATMETAVSIGRLPAAGSTVQAFMATTEIGRKHTRSTAWAFDLATAEPVIGFEVVALAFDVDTRRSMEIPAGHREARGTNFHPEFAAS